MSDPFVGQITPFAFTYPPKQWAFCDGTTMPINQYSALYALIGAQFGGNGTTQFNLPNLGGRSPGGFGQGPGLTARPMGSIYGAEGVTLDLTTMAGHTHGANALALGRGGSATVTPTTTSGLAAQGAAQCYSNVGVNVAMHPLSVTPTGGNGAHNNMQPWLTINYSIALTGIFPQFS